MKLFDRITEKFRRKQREESIVEDQKTWSVYKGRPQHGTGHPTTHSKKRKAARRAGRR